MMNMVKTNQATLTKLTIHPKRYLTFMGDPRSARLRDMTTNIIGMQVAEQRHNTAAPINALKAAVDTRASNPRI